MSTYSYKKGQFPQLLRKLEQRKINGVLLVDNQVESDQKDNQNSHILIWKNGGLVYADLQNISPRAIVKKMLYKLNPKMAQSAIKFLIPKINKSSSLRQMLLLLVERKALNWKEIEAFVQKQAIIVIEDILSRAGTARVNPLGNLDMSLGEDGHSLNLLHLNQEIKKRQKTWRSLSPEVPSIDAIPEAKIKDLNEIPRLLARYHVQKSINGKQSLIEIAETLDKDPLVLARSYRNWVKSGWIHFPKHLQPNNDKDLEKPTLTDFQTQEDLYTILSVDDSQIVQASIKRVLQDTYKVLLSDNAFDALNILNQNPVDLLLLDVTMPNINGLEMCRTLRTIPKFKNLPIVMVTARDSFVDKMKGKFAGTSCYLTKPFDNQELLQIVGKLIGQNNPSPVSA